MMVSISACGNAGGCCVSKIAESLFLLLSSVFNDGSVLGTMNSALSLGSQFTPSRFCTDDMTFSFATLVMLT